MQKLELIDALLLGNEALDNDHRDLVDLANKLIESIKDKNSDGTQQYLSDFCKRFCEHEKFEIEFLNEIGFPNVRSLEIHYNNMYREIQYLYHLFDRAIRNEIGWKTFRDALASGLFETLIREDLSFKSFLIECGHSTHSGR